MNSDKAPISQCDQYEGWVCKVEREGDPDGGSSGHRENDVGAEEGRGHCCSANHDDDEDEEWWRQMVEGLEEPRKCSELRPGRAVAEIIMEGWGFII